jgi:hypothetical protein
VKRVVGRIKMGSRKAGGVEVKTDYGEDRRQREVQNELRAVARS